MKARIDLDLTSDSSGECQGLLKGILDRLVTEGSVADYRFEIEPGEGPVTEGCILSGEKVVA